MAKQIKNKKPIMQANKAELKRHRYLIAIPIIAFVIKLITMGNTQGGGWLGADGGTGARERRVVPPSLRGAAAGGRAARPAL
mgnify:CR=1 FL=1